MTTARKIKQQYFVGIYCNDCNQFLEHDIAGIGCINMHVVTYLAKPIMRAKVDYSTLKG